MIKMGGKKNKLKKTQPNKQKIYYGWEVFAVLWLVKSFFFSLSIPLYYSLAFVVLKIVWEIYFMMQFYVKGNHITELNIKQSKELKINWFGFLRGSADKHFGQPMHFVDNV